MAKSKLPFPEGTVVAMARYTGVFIVKACPAGREHYDFYASDMGPRGWERGFPAINDGVTALVHGPEEGERK